MTQKTFLGLTTTLTGPMTAVQTSLPVTQDILSKLLLGLGVDGYTWLIIADDFNTEVVKTFVLNGTVFLNRNIGLPGFAFPVGTCVYWDVTDESVQDRACNTTCATVVDPTCPCVVPTEGATAIPNGMRELPWEGAFNFLGSSPLALTIVAAPAWVTYTVGSNFVKFVGTPTVSGAYSVSVKANNACGTVTVTKGVTISPKASDSDDCPTSLSTCSGGRIFFKMSCAVPPVDPQIAAEETRMGARLTMYAHCGACELPGCEDTITGDTSSNAGAQCTTADDGIVTCITKVRAGFICSVNSLTGIITCIKKPAVLSTMLPELPMPSTNNPVSPPARGNNPPASCSALRVHGMTVSSGAVGDYNSSAGTDIAIAVTLATPATQSTFVKYESWGNYTEIGLSSATTTTRSIPLGDTLFSDTISVLNTPQPDTPSTTLGVNGALRITITKAGCENFTYIMFNRESPGGQ